MRRSTLRTTVTICFRYNNQVFQPGRAMKWPSRRGRERAGSGRAAPGHIQLVLFVFFRLAVRGASALPGLSVGGAPAGTLDTVGSLTQTQGASLQRSGSVKRLWEMWNDEREAASETAQTQLEQHLSSKAAQKLLQNL